MPEALFKKLVGEYGLHVVGLRTNRKGKTPYIDVTLRGHMPRSNVFDEAQSSAQKTCGVVIAHASTEPEEPVMGPGGWTPLRTPPTHSFTITPKRSALKTATTHMAKATEYLRAQLEEHEALLAKLREKKS